MSAERKAFIRNVAEVPWDELPGHHGGALSKLLVHPERGASRHIDHRISMYQPKAHVARHSHKVQEQVYPVLDGNREMIFAFGADLGIPLDFLAIDDLTTMVALEPKALLKFRLFPAIPARWAVFFEPSHGVPDQTVTTWPSSKKWRFGRLRRLSSDPISPQTSMGDRVRPAMLSARSDNPLM